MTVSRRIARGSGNCGVLLLIGSGFNAVIAVYFIVNELGFLCINRDGVEWW